MRLVFMGTPKLAADILPSLVERHEVVGVFTRPDAVRGRGKKLTASPVKQVALDLGLEVFTPASLVDGEAARIMRDLDVDVACVVAYGALIPMEILEIPRFGCINAHMSLLPRWRGAAPVQRAMLSGDEYCGVSIMKIEEGLDSGPYCLQEEIEIDDKYLGQLEEELAEKGASGFLESLERIESGDVEWIEQVDDGVTYARKIDKSELLLDPQSTAWENVSRVRASSEAHPARMVFDGRPITVLRAAVLADDDMSDVGSELSSGEAVFARKRIIARASNGRFELICVKPDGKKSMDGRSFAAGIQGAKNKVLSWEKA